MRTGAEIPAAVEIPVAAEADEELRIGNWEPGMKGLGMVPGSLSLWV